MAYPLILIVDDDTDLGLVLGELLESLGYRAQIATDVTTAKSMLAETRPSLVMLDWVLPGGDPAELARICHARHIPVVLSSACADALDLAESIGAAATLTKPFHAEGLTSLFERLLGPRAGARP